MKLLVIGDVVGEAGIDALHGLLRRIKRDTGADFVIVNGENAAGNGAVRMFSVRPILRRKAPVGVGAFMTARRACACSS